jgi:hypothetical protein
MRRSRNANSPAKNHPLGVQYHTIDYSATFRPRSKIARDFAEVFALLSLIAGRPTGALLQLSRYAGEDRRIVFHALDCPKKGCHAASLSGG